MEKPVLSADFTLEDIRKLRDYNSYKHNQMTKDEIIRDIQEGASKTLEYLEKRKERQIVYF